MLWSDPLLCLPTDQNILDIKAAGVGTAAAARLIFMSAELTCHRSPQDLLYQTED